MVLLEPPVSDDGDNSAQGAADQQRGSLSCGLPATDDLLDPAAGIIDANPPPAALAQQQQDLPSSLPGEREGPAALAAYRFERGQGPPNVRVQTAPDDDIHTGTVGGGAAADGAHPCMDDRLVVVALGSSSRAMGDGGGPCLQPAHHHASPAGAFGPALSRGRVAVAVATGAATATAAATPQCQGHNTALPGQGRGTAASHEAAAGCSQTVKHLELPERPVGSLLGDTSARAAAVAPTATVVISENPANATASDDDGGEIRKTAASHADEKVYPLPQSTTPTAAIGDEAPGAVDERVIGCSRRQLAAAGGAVASTVRQKDSTQQSDVKQPSTTPNILPSHTVFQQEQRLSIQDQYGSDERGGCSKPQQQGHLGHRPLEPQLLLLDRGGCSRQQLLAASQGEPEEDECSKARQHREGGGLESTAGGGGSTGVGDYTGSSIAGARGCGSSRINILPVTNAVFAKKLLDLAPEVPSNAVLGNNNVSTPLSLFGATYEDRVLPAKVQVFVSYKGTHILDLGHYFLRVSAQGSSQQQRSPAGARMKLTLGGSGTLYKKFPEPCAITGWSRLDQATLLLHLRAQLGTIDAPELQAVLRHCFVLPVAGQPQQDRLRAPLVVGAEAALGALGRVAAANGDAVVASPAVDGLLHSAAASPAGDIHLLGAGAPGGIACSSAAEPPLTDRLLFGLTDVPSSQQHYTVGPSKGWSPPALATRLLSNNAVSYLQPTWNQANVSARSHVETSDTCAGVPSPKTAAGGTRGNSGGQLEAAIISPRTDVVSSGLLASDDNGGNFLADRLPPPAAHHTSSGTLAATAASLGKLTVAGADAEQQHEQELAGGEGGNSRKRRMIDDVEAGRAQLYLLTAENQFDEGPRNKGPEEWGALHDGLLERIVHAQRQGTGGGMGRGLKGTSPATSTTTASVHGMASQALSLNLGAPASITDAFLQQGSGSFSSLNAIEGGAVAKPPSSAGYSLLRRSTTPSMNPSRELTLPLRFVDASSHQLVQRLQRQQQPKPLQHKTNPELRVWSSHGGGNPGVELPQAGYPRHVGAQPRSWRDVARSGDDGGWALASSARHQQLPPSPQVNQARVKRSRDDAGLTAAGGETEAEPMLRPGSGLAAAHSMTAAAEDAVEPLLRTVMLARTALARSSAGSGIGGTEDTFPSGATKKELERLCNEAPPPSGADTLHFRLLLEWRRMEAQQQQQQAARDYASGERVRLQTAEHGPLTAAVRSGLDFAGGSKSSHLSGGYQQQDGGEDDGDERAVYPPQNQLTTQLLIALLGAGKIDHLRQQISQPHMLDHQQAPLRSQRLVASSSGASERPPAGPHPSAAGGRVHVDEEAAGGVDDDVPMDDDELAARTARDEWHNDARTRILLALTDQIRARSQVQRQPEPATFGNNVLQLLGPAALISQRLAVRAGTVGEQRATFPPLRHQNPTRCHLPVPTPGQSGTEALRAYSEVYGLDDSRHQQPAEEDVDLQQRRQALLELSLLQRRNPTGLSLAGGQQSERCDGDAGGALWRPALWAAGDPSHICVEAAGSTDHHDERLCAPMAAPRAALSSDVRRGVTSVTSSAGRPVASAADELGEQILLQQVHQQHPRAASSTVQLQVPTDDLHVQRRHQAVQLQKRVLGRQLAGPTAVPAAAGAGDALEDPGKPEVGNQRASGAVSYVPVAKPALKDEGIGGRTGANEEGVRGSGAMAGPRSFAGPRRIASNAAAGKVSGVDSGGGPGNFGGAGAGGGSNAACDTAAVDGRGGNTSSDGPTPLPSLPDVDTVISTGRGLAGVAKHFLVVMNCLRTPANVKMRFLSYINGDVAQEHLLVLYVFLQDACNDQDREAVSKVLVELVELMDRGGGNN